MPLKGVWILVYFVKMYFNYKMDETNFQKKYRFAHESNIKLLTTNF